MAKGSDVRYRGVHAARVIRVENHAGEEASYVVAVKNYVGPSTLSRSSGAAAAPMEAGEGSGVFQVGETLQYHGAGRFRAVKVVEIVSDPEENLLAYVVEYEVETVKKHLTPLASR